MSCGTPNRGKRHRRDPRKYVGDAGLVCPNDAEALAHALLAVLANDELAHRLGIFARERAIGYDFKYAAAGHREVYTAFGKLTRPCQL